MPGSGPRSKYLVPYRSGYSRTRLASWRCSRSLDNGKPIRESRDVDIPTAAAHFFYYAGWADKLGYAGFGPAPRPIGVAGQIIPWNFPLLMAAWKIAPALACGNTVVLKPAETTPLTALMLAEIIAEAGLPPGVVNVLAGGPPVGQALVEHPDVDKIAFTGSTEVGKAIAGTVAGTGKRLTLELGGKAANIVFDDAPIDQAVEGIVNGIFFNQGHVCCAGSRLLVQESIADEADRFVTAPNASRHCGSGTRWTRTPTSAPSTRPSSSTKHPASCPDAGDRRRAPSRWTLALSSCPTAAISSPRRVFTGVSQSHAHRP